MLSQDNIQNIAKALVPEIVKALEPRFKAIEDRLGRLESRFDDLEVRMNQRFEKVEKQAEENFQTIVRYLEGTYDIQSTKLKEFKSIIVRSDNTLTEAKDIRI